jgi:hypothetical protein
MVFWSEGNFRGGEKGVNGVSTLASSSSEDSSPLSNKWEVFGSSSSKVGVALEIS